uniref:EngB-type G domain-containing protein n=1 Tax=Fagus sylvatica TaxID=28930 RepID=A0A2N9G0Z2_FAGSY
MLLRNRILSPQLSSFLSHSSLLPFQPKPRPFTLSFPTHFSNWTGRNPTQNASTSASASASKTTQSGPISDTARLVRTVLFVPPGVDPEEVFVKSSGKAKECPKDHRPEFAILGRSNVGKSSLINSLVRKKEVALTSKKPGKTQLINHFLVNKSWYIVDLPGYGFAKAPDAARMDWSSFTKGYFLNRDTLVAVLLLIDASVPPQKIDLDCANWLGRNNIPMTLVFTKCDKMKPSKGKRPDENISDFQEVIKQNYREHPPWIMTSSVTGLGRDDLLLHMSQLRNYWDQ